MYNLLLQLYFTLLGCVWIRRWIWRNRFKWIWKEKKMKLWLFWLWKRWC